MKKRDIVSLVSKKTNFTKENTEIAVDAIIEVLAEAMEAGEDKIILKGIGTFNKKVRAARTCHDPRNGDAIEVPEKVVYGFKISGQLQDKING